MSIFIIHLVCVSVSDTESCSFMRFKWQFNELFSMFDAVCVDVINTILHSYICM